MNWVFRSGMNNPKYLAESTHLASSCTACHGGADGTAVKADAHAGMQAIPGADSCSASGCHAATATLAANSLHTTVKGYEVILAARGFDLTDATSAARYEKQCAKCHVANSESQAACGHCHVSVPDSAGGGLIAGHRMVGTPSTVNNCTACHGSRVKDEYFGQNQALYVRNQAVTAGLGDPFAGSTLAPDVHKTGGMECVDCHAGSEMHGQGVTAGIDRYGVTSAPQCLDCHSTSETNVDSPAYMGQTTGIHRPGHLSSMACQVCHAQPYKSCFGCHTQETATGAGYFVINTTDPTREARAMATPWDAGTTYAAGVYVTYAGTYYRSLAAANLGNQPDTSPTWWVAALPAGDALITFRAGKNPRYVTGNALGEKKYGVLRHVPVDADVFTYTIEGTPAPGLLPGLTGLSTWKFATPHNIARTTPIAAACGNCHGADYAKFWLTDAIDNAYGWIPGTETWEDTANAGVTVGAPLPMTYTP